MASLQADWMPREPTMRVDVVIRMCRADQDDQPRRNRRDEECAKRDHTGHLAMAPVTERGLSLTRCPSLPDLTIHRPSAVRPVILPT
jgi:hypothetical protein